jgi:tRNA threonylcarbamoyladenosine biosynthesis protein TsaE
MTRLRSTSAEATLALGEALGRVLSAGDVVGLDGDLGAGKTVFVKGIARGLGLDDLGVTSPTFTLVQRHEGGRLPLVHADLYRVEDVAELDEIGLWDQAGEDAVCAVEWIARAPKAVPADRLELRFEVDGDGRWISATANGEASAALLARWQPVG